MTHGFIDRKPILKGLYLRFLEQELHLPISETLYAAVWATATAKMIEIKGTSDSPEVIELPHEEETFCLVYQFIGNSTLSTSGNQPLKSGQHTGCHAGSAEQLICRIDRGKTWMLFICLSGQTLQSFRPDLESLMQPPAAPFSIRYRQKHLFDKIQQLKIDTFMLGIKLDYHIALLLEQYGIDLETHVKATDSADIALYRKALVYIQTHYLERKLTRQQIADALCVSTRTLYRAFEGQQVTIRKAIELARLHKAREWLRADQDIPIDHVAAELHFADPWSGYLAGNRECSPMEKSPLLPVRIPEKGSGRRMETHAERYVYPANRQHGGFSGVRVPGFVPG